MADDSKHWYMQWDVGDWLKDPAVSFCSAATRGIWFDLICGMHQFDRSGKLTGSRDQLARIGRCSAVELAQALSELQGTGAADVTQRDGNVTVICRRMKREADLRKSATERKQRQRARERDERDTVASRDCPPTYTIDHKPETINQSPQPKAQNSNTNQPEGDTVSPAALGAGVVGFLEISPEDLRDTGRVLELGELLLGRSLSERDRVIVLTLAVRALARSNQSPGGFFRTTVLNQETWKFPTNAEDRLAQKRLQDFDKANKNSVQAMKGVLSGMAKGGSQ